MDVSHINEQGYMNDSSEIKAENLAASQKSIVSNFRYPSNLVKNALCESC